MTTLVYVAAIAVMFLLLIGPHEAGHLLMAKLFKVRVIEFSIGAGVKLWSTTRGGTMYALRAIPILGYVRMGGMEEGDFDDANGFHSKPSWQRILILAGGPAVNFLVAILFVTAVGLTQLNDDPGKVAQVVPGTPAAAAGFQAGDHLRTVNGHRITAPDQLKKAEDAAPGAALVVTGVHASGQPFAYVVTPQCDPTGNGCQMGLRVSPVLTAQGAITEGVKFPFVVIGNLVQGMSELITGKVPGGLLGPNGVTGTVGIADVAYQSASLGLASYIFLVALVSVALGFTNLLPLPALDGGRIFVVLVEVLRRRPFDRATELKVQRWGLAALLVLAVLINLHDVQLIVTKQFPGMH
jgi:regulator of sigma E protease